MSTPFPKGIDFAGEPKFERSRDVETTDPKIRKLLGPKGEVLRTFSDRPPVGFHQGTRETTR